MTIPLLAFPKVPADGSEAASRDDWIATEKIHGAQLVLGTDGSEVDVGKRKEWLGPEDAFFGWQILRSELHAAARGIHHALGGQGLTWIYGELFGGRYPHPDVSPVTGLIPVQTGIWYAPDLRYAVFDIAHGPDERSASFLAHERIEELTADAGLARVPVLGRGRYAELDRLPLRFPTRVPAALGFPSLEANFAEGYVLKPASETTVAGRPSTKRKIAEFDELRFDESSAFDPNAHLSREELLALARHLVNPARLASARSKVGTDARRISEEAALDAFVDLRDLYPRRVDALTPEHERELLEFLEARAREAFLSEPASNVPPVSPGKK
jgi:Rnl2 family RNA ligase